MKSLIWPCGLLLTLLVSCTEQNGSLKVSKPQVDCTQLNLMSSKASSNIYTIQPAGSRTLLKVYCEMRPDGGWTVIQRRTGQAVSFRRNWANYENGFGHLIGDHWLGLKKIFLMMESKSKKWTLRVDLWDHEGNTAYAQYRNFRLGDPTTAYKLNVGFYSGNAGDAIRDGSQDQNGYGFSTVDRDNDGCSPCIFGDIAEEQCTFSEGGGWWYSKCGSASLNGDYHSNGNHIGWASGLHWHTWKKIPYSLKATRMMIKSESTLAWW
ncbi:fibrinogen-like protein 1 isoform X2 [Gouania willdenowi]|uniref:fibrinogen-like protein 1 isoform X2 n=1 Tax=Gouania willdenowi TaxID=441366 RepID=UPI001054323D|nr:fibrinogen-like protein 1 isoform X2 [Gouania willdenowi]